MKEIIEALFFSLYLSLSLVGIGGFFSRKLIFGSQPLNKALEYTISFTTGFGIYALFYFAYYIFFHTPSIVLVLSFQTIGIALGARYFNGYWLSIKRIFSGFNLKNKNSIWVILFCIPFFTAMAMFMFMSLSPVKLGDAINGYLETARWIFHNGHSTYDPYNTKYSTMPAYTEILYSLSFAFKSEIGAKIFDAICGFSMLIAIYAVCSIFINRTLAAFSAISFLFVEDFTFIFGGGKVDLPCQLVFFASIIMLVLNIGKPLNKKYLSLSAFLFAVSLGQKYTIGLFIPLYAGLLLYLLFKNKLPLSQIIKILVPIALLGMVVALPNLIRNYIWCNNPFAPFNNPLFHSKIHITPHEYSKSTFMTMRDVLLFPKTMFLDPKRLPFTLLVGLILYFINWNKLKQWNPVMIIAIVQFVIWVIIFKEYWYNSRFLFGLLALFIVLAAIAINRYFIKYRYVQVLMYLFSIGILIFLTNDLKRFSHNLEFASGKISKEKWEEKYNTRCVGLIKEISPSLDKNSKMMCLGGVVFKIPYDKLQYTNTEKERFDFEAGNHDKNYLLTHGFKFLLYRPANGFVSINQTPNENNASSDERLPEWLRNKTPLIKKTDGVVYKID